MHLINNGGNSAISFNSQGPGVLGAVSCNYMRTGDFTEPLKSAEFTTYPPLDLNVPYTVPEPYVYPYTPPTWWGGAGGTGVTPGTMDDSKPEPLTFEDIRIAPSVKLHFDDISTEDYRTYHYADGSTVTYLDPVALAITKGGHRLITADGECHYILTTWQRISWKVPGEEFHFVK